MSQFNRFAAPAKVKVARKTSAGNIHVDYKDVDKLRRLMSPNGKIYARKRLQSNAFEQRLISLAIKRARFMALLPYTSATL